MEEKRISIEAIRSISDLIDKKMEAGIQYTWEKFFKIFVPNILDIDFWDTADRYRIKKGVNEEFGKQKIPKLLFVRKDVGPYLLDSDSGVAARRFLDGVRKEASAIDTAVERCRILAETNGLPEGDRRMLTNASNTIDSNKSVLMGNIGRMKSVPRPVKLEAMRLLGMDLD